MPWTESINRLRPGCKEKELIFGTWNVRRKKDSKKGSKRELPYHKPVGRPRNRWADVIQMDALQLLGIKGWRRRAANRDKWRHFMRETKAWKGL
jgi:hypothetical protein